MILDSKILKQMNIDSIKTALLAEEGGTKNSLSKLTGLSVATCRNILEELLANGEIIELDLAASTGGRPSRQFQYNGDFTHIALVFAQIEGSEKSLNIKVIDVQGRAVYEHRSTHNEIDTEVMRAVLTKLMQEDPKVSIITIGIPGVVEGDSVGLCDLEQLNYIPLVSVLKENISAEIIMENDVNAMALGLVESSNEPTAESLVYLYYPQEGLAGAGIIVHGKPLIGQRHFAGEISHLPLYDNREEQVLAQQSNDSFAEMVAKTIVSLHCVLDPQRVVLAGKVFNEELLDMIRRNLSHATILDHHIQVDFDPHMRDTYFKGLAHLGIKKHLYPYEVVER